MKKTKLSLAAILMVGGFSSINAESLKEAFENGKVSGDFSVMYENRSTDRDTTERYFADTAYSVASLGLYYKTASYKNFSLSIGMRAFTNLYEEDKNFRTYHGKGDSSERFYEEKGHSILTDTYLAYDTENIHVKIGRQQLYEESLTYLFDGVTVRTTPIENMNLDFIYVNARGRADTKNIRPVEDINNNDGVYKVGLAYKFNENVSSKIYYLEEPDKASIIGGKLSLSTNIDDIKLGLNLESLKTSEDTDAEDGQVNAISAYTIISGYTFTLGYYETDKDGGWGSADDYGETIVPFEEGDSSYFNDAKTTYFQVSKDFNNLSLTALYGIIDYQDKKAKELDIWAGYKFSKNLSLNIGYSYIDEDDKNLDSPDMNQFNAVLSYRF